MRNRSLLLTLALAAPLLVAAAPTQALAAAAAPAPRPAVREAPLPNPLPAPVEVVDNGPSANRIDLAFAGDGYTRAELPKYQQAVNDQWAAMTALEPYKSYANFFNVWRVDLVSPESGITGDPTRNVVKQTPLNMHFFCHGIDRLLCVDDSRSQALARQVPNADVIFAIANSGTYGGAGGPVITVAGGNPLASQVTPHEAAHTLAQIGDEYGGFGAASDVSEPAQPNLGTLTADQMAQRKAKWWRWLGETAPDGSKIGAYPGGNYFDSGYYRPSDDSNMRTLGKPFNQPSAEALIKSFYKFVKPIDSQSAPNGAYLDRTATVSISTPKLVGTDFQIYWGVNGQLYNPAYGKRTLSLGALAGSLPKNQWVSLSVTVRDTTKAVRDEDFRNSSMTQTASWWIKPN
jgi:IgA Peptidase M64